MKRTILGLALCVGLTGSMVALVPVKAVATKTAAVVAPVTCEVVKATRNYKKFFVVGGVVVAATVGAYYLYQWYKSQEATPASEVK